MSEDGKSKIAGPPTRDFTAKETTTFAGDDRKITVCGEVELRSTGAKAELVRREPQGFISSTLVLILKVTAGGGGDALTWRTVSYSEPVSLQQFTKVTVEFEDKPLVQLDVELVLS